LDVAITIRMALSCPRHYLAIKPMRIAQVSPLYQPVPPRRYGGTERIVAHLTEELVRLGHDVTLFAAAGSRTRAELVSFRPPPEADGRPLDDMLSHTTLLEEVMSRAGEFDLVHFHLDFVHLPLLARDPQAALTTLHNRLDDPLLRRLLARYPQMALCGISDSQRAGLRNVAWTVHHGLPRELLMPRFGPGRYLAFLGRASPEKGLLDAMRIARSLRLPLKIAARVDAIDRRQLGEAFVAALQDPLFELVGEIDDAAKGEFLGGAIALLFPVAWPEPFGLVMIEAMACGTPVIAYRAGAVPEVMVDGVSGFVVDDADDAAAAVERAMRLSRKSVREVFDERFTADRMARDYLEIYGQLARGRREARWTKTSS
jgi:glycosyltransferase involved in cell wall biosynthesis